MTALLTEILRSRAHDTPNARAYVFLDTAGDEAEVLTYHRLHTRAQDVASALRTQCRPGERALLLFGPGLDFIVAYFGCLYAGVIAVPVNPPRPGRPHDATNSIVVDCAPTVVLSDAPTRSATESELTAVAGGLRWITVDETPERDDEEFAPPALESTAFLQYTSGSTSRPKGVRVTHHNLVANQRMIAAAFGHDRHSTFVGWAPLFHDQGLIGNVLQPLYLGATSILMSPWTFIRRPLLWPLTVSKYRAHTSGGPNFAFDACVTHAERTPIPADLDLASWQVAFNGAEPIRADTIERFAGTFAPYGFRPSAMYPCYGLAEATLFVAGSVKGRGPKNLSVDADELTRGRMIPAADAPSRTVVGSGVPAAEGNIRIADPSSAESLADNMIGEIRVSGPHVSPGYWGHSETGKELCTGDLGAVVDGELYVVGRIKDVIIVRGKNYYPHDIENTVRIHVGGPKSLACAAFAIADAQGIDKLVIIAETSADHEVNPPAVREAVTREHGLTVGELVVTNMRLQKTSSGKLMRAAAKARYLRGEFS